MENSEAAFSLLDGRIQRYLFEEGWTSLREIQVRAILSLASGARDCLLAATTASGKTEAAFLPLLNHYLKQRDEGGSAREPLLVYVGPLRALINDQFARIDRLCQRLDIRVWPWHGEISASIKKRFKENPSGVLLITPEALEAQLCNDGFNIPDRFALASAIVIDELHAYMGTERGTQLQSQLHRLDIAVKHAIPRIGLSATLGDFQMAAEFLRPGHGSQVNVIDPPADRSEVKILLRGLYKEDEYKVVDNIYQMRGSANLVFPNSRNKVEEYTCGLAQKCQSNGVDDSFFAHHGNLSREIRGHAEYRMRSSGRPTTILCTSTLELGIDIGHVDTVVQVNAAPGVSGLRQRVGRSGRRNGTRPRLLAYGIDEPSLSPLDLHNHLLQIAAEISLLEEGWCESPSIGRLNGSTLVQQLISLSMQWGGISFDDAFRTLCGNGGAFVAIGREAFRELVDHLLSRHVLLEDSEGMLMTGIRGQKIASQYSFYATFHDAPLLQVIHHRTGKDLGTHPIASRIEKGACIVFNGKYWIIESLDPKRRILRVEEAASGMPAFLGDGFIPIGGRIRQRMREILEGRAESDCWDEQARKMIGEAKAYFREEGIGERPCHQVGQKTVLYTWLGDAANYTLALWLGKESRGHFECFPLGVYAQSDMGVDRLYGCLDRLAQGETIVPEELLHGDEYRFCSEKWDYLLPPSMRMQNFISKFLDVEEVMQWARSLNL